MQILTPNENGVYQTDHEEVVASRRRSRAAISIALCDDGGYRFSTELHYSTGGFCGPIFASSPPYSSFDVARTAALEELLRQWPTAWPSEGASVHAELAELKRQIETQVMQPRFV